MNALTRWWTFNAVGALGATVQLASLWLLHRWTGGHVLLSSLAATELALVHNLLWHRRFTWRDRRGNDGVGQRMRFGRVRLQLMRFQLMRFQMSNGTVSLLGNMVLTRVLVVGASLPLLVANGIAILCCAVVNFQLGHRWVFAATRTTSEFT